MISLDISPRTRPIHTKLDRVIYEIKKKVVIIFSYTKNIYSDMYIQLFFSIKIKRVIKELVKSLKLKY